MQKRTWHCLAISALAGSAYPALASPADAPIVEEAPLAELTSQHTIPLSAAEARTAVAADFWQSRARLADGSCVWLTDSPTRVADCEYVAEDKGILSWPCNGPAERSTSTWFVECTGVQRGRTRITAHRNEDPTDRRLLAEVDHELVRISAISLHGRFVEVRTLGVGRDGQTIVSAFGWYLPAMKR